MTFFQSSMKPSVPYPRRMASAIQTTKLVSRAHRSVDTVMERIIGTPPIVGVPILFSMWV